MTEENTLVAEPTYRAKIESLLDESRDERLADVWQRLYPFPIDPAYELPDRRGIIEDLADFAEALQPSLNGMKADRLCRLIEKYAACESRQSDLSVSHIGTASMSATIRMRTTRTATAVGNRNLTSSQTTENLERLHWQS
jgi:hypothetical protein